MGQNTNSLEDVILWPCGTWCYRENLEEFLSFMSDDFEVLRFDTPQWTEIVDAQ